MEVDINNSNIQIDSLEDHSLTIFRCQSWPYGFLIGFLTVSTMVTIVGKMMIIYYMTNYAPKRRPINWIILFDQVNYIITQSDKDSQCALGFDNLNKDF